MLTNFFNQLRSNARLRWGVMLIVGIFWLYGVLVLRDSLQEQTEQQRVVVQSISRLRAQLAQTEWATRLLPAKVLAVQLEGKLWQAPTSGLAQAAFQDWLNATLLKAAVTSPQVSVTVVDDALTGPNTSSAIAAGTSGTADPNAVPLTPTDLWKIKAKISFELGATAASDFLARLESSDKQIVVGALNVRKEPSPRVEMELFAFFQKPATAGGSTGLTVPPATSSGSSGSSAAPNKSAGLP